MKILIPHQNKSAIRKIGLLTTRLTGVSNGDSTAATPDKKAILMKNKADAGLLSRFYCQ
jgi:hypothetical protein